jgi:hypothetical protein
MSVLERAVENINEENNVDFFDLWSVQTRATWQIHDDGTTQPLQMNWMFPSYVI